MVALRAWRAYTTPFPLRLRRWISVETPGLGSHRLCALLEPVPGEHLLEVGPGIGLYSLPAAGWLTKSGTLDVLDLQAGMLEETLARAHERGIGNLVATQGDAQRMPYPDAGSERRIGGPITYFARFAVDEPVAAPSRLQVGRDA